MSEKNYEVLKLLVIAIKWKKFLIVFFILTLILSYLAIYFLVDERFEASSLLLPSQEENTSSLLSSLKGLPIDLGGINSESSADLYKSIVYSRSMLNDVIERFDIYRVYKIDTSTIGYYEATLEKLRDNIKANMNDDDITYSITVTAPHPQLAANMANFIVKALNEKIVDLKIKKSMLNREYLAERVQDVKDSLKGAEEKLKVFSEKTGMFEAKDQTKAILEQLAQFQAKLAEKQTEASIYSKIYGENSPQAINAKVIATQLEEKLRKMEKGEDSDNTLLSLNKLPQNAVNYIRYFRDVEIYNNMLKFVLPLYEQAKFQEQKDVPILQVIDVAIPPAKRSFPKRTILSLLISITVMLIVFIFILLKENRELSSSEEIIYIKNNLFKWKTRS